MLSCLTERAAALPTRIADALRYSMVLAVQVPPEQRLPSYAARLLRHIQRRCRPPKNARRHDPLVVDCGKWACEGSSCTEITVAKLPLFSSKLFDDHREELRWR